MSRRGRAIGFAGLALVCAVASASIASGYRESVDERLGEVRSVVTVDRPLPAGVVLRGRLLRSALVTRTVPTRFLPPDAIPDPAQVSGRRTARGDPGRVPTCWHRTCDRPSGGARTEPVLNGDLHPVEVTVSAAGSLASGGAGARVDVVVAGEPVTGGRARVRVAAENVRLISVRPRIQPTRRRSAVTAGARPWP